MKLYYEKPKDYKKNKYDYLSLKGIGKDFKEKEVYFEYYDAMIITSISKDSIRWYIRGNNTFEEYENMKDVVVTPPPYPKEVIELLKIFSEAAAGYSSKGMNWPYIRLPNMQFVYKDTIYEIDIESWFKDIRIFKNFLLSLFESVLLEIEDVYLVYYHDFEIKD